MTTADADREAPVCEACGGSGLKVMGCILFECPECEGEGIRDK